MITYEVNINVNQDIYSAYHAWLLTHVKTILQYAGFKKAEIGLIMDNENINEKKLRINYIVDSLKHLEDYLLHHAPHMRAEAVQQFSDQFTITRRIIDKPIIIETEN